jgi:diacylglycerol O-acyltransferase
MQTMSPLDASFLHIEDATTHMHLGSVGIFEGPPPAPDEVPAAVAARLPLVPRYRQKVRFVPLALGRPVWVDDPHFDLDYHVRRTGLPAPGGEAELRRLVGRVMSQQLDRAKPLWEIWVVEGMEDERWAVISKAHHCMVDGVAATDILSVLLDKDRQPEPPASDSWSPEPEPGPGQLVARSLAGRAVSPYEGLRTAMAMARAPRRFVGEALTVAKGVANMRQVAAPGGAPALNGPVGPHRRWGWARSRLSDIKQIRQAHGGTVNDVVLTAITGAFRELLLARGEELAGHAVRTLVPVSVRAADQHGTYDNKVSAMFAELPVEIEDPLERLEAVSEQMQQLKASGQAVAAERLTALGGFAPAMLLALAGRIGTALPQRAVNTVTTNVPGPQQPLFLAGRRMLEAFPFVPLGGHVRIGVAIFSYDGGVNFGVTADRDGAPDLDLFCQAIERSLAELLPSPPPARHRERTDDRARRAAAKTEG